VASVWPCLVYQRAAPAKSCTLWGVIAVGSALVALLVDLDEHVDGRIDRLEVVELVFALEARGSPRVDTCVVSRTR